MSLLPETAAAENHIAAETPSLVGEEAVFRLLVDGLVDAVFFHDPVDSRVLYVNDTACRNLGRSRDELLGKPIWEYSGVMTSLEEWQSAVRRIETEGSVLVEACHCDRDGYSKDVEIKATTLQAGARQYVVSVARDITLRKEAERRLLEEHSMIEAIMAAIGDGITVQDRDYRILYQNDVQIAKQGRHLGELCYRAYRKRDRICDDCQAARSFADGLIHRRQTATVGLHGPMHLEVTACPLRNGSGEIVACVEVVRDITEQKTIEQALHESNEKYRLLFSAESDAILTYDTRSGEIQEVNDAACRLYGLAREVFVGRCWFGLLAESGEEGSDRWSAMHRRGDGTLFPVEFSSGHFHWQGKSMAVAVVRDVSERLRVERSREEVFSVISHEIRTPLTAILGFAEYLLEGETDDPRREFLQLIIRESERMWHLIDNLLSLKRLLAGFGLENPTALSLPPLLEEAVDSFRTPLPRQQIAIDCSDMLRPIVGDASSILQALKNLIGNALKYSPVTSTIVLGAQADDDHALIWVRDEGAGIPADQQEKIFERFYRVRGRGPGGTGIGLALVREIAHAHGGRVWVDSTPGQGSTFYMSLPFAD